MSKFLPARKTGRAGDEFLKTHKRNRWLYCGLIAAFYLGFLMPFALFPPGADGRVGVGQDDWIAAWFAGAFFGLPFFSTLVFVVVIWLALGKRRARELLIYFETKQQASIYIFYILGAVLAPIGVVSSVFLCSARMI